MTMNAGWMKWLVPVSMAFLLISCGGGGGGGGTGGGSAISGKVPYLVSGPSVTFRSSPTVTGMYDVTVTLEADGPSGVKVAYVWLFDETDDSDTQPVDLFNTPGTKRWTGSTYSFFPLAPGQFSIDEIILEDGEYPADDTIGSGWYFVMPIFSTSMYYVDESIVTFPTPSTIQYLYFGGGLTSKPVRRFTLP